MVSKILAAFLACTCTAALMATIPAASGVGPLSAAFGTAGAAAFAGLTSSGAGPVDSSQDILGAWDIASFDGYTPQQRMDGTARAAIADFREDGVVLRIECNTSGAAGTVRGGAFRHRPSDEVQTEMGCGREREARDTRLFAFFRADPRVDLLADGRLRLTAGEAELLLERPAQRRLAFLPKPQELLGEWRLVEISRSPPGGGSSGIGLSDVPGLIVIDGITMSYSRCPAQAVAYRYTSEGVLEKTGGPSLPDPPRGCAPLEGGWSGGNLPVRGDVLRVLHGSPAVEKTGRDGLLLSAGEYTLLLTRAP